jgi:hypothetical protein
MSLQLRRGTNLERQSVVLREGELIYTTDTKVLYVGDGTTLGGVPVGSGPGFGGSLGSNINLNGFEINGLGDIDITGTISATAFVGITLETLEDVNISIINEDDVISFAGSQFTNRSIEDITFGKNLTASILSTDGSSVIINADTSEIFGSFKGVVRDPFDAVVLDPNTRELFVNRIYNDDSIILESTNEIIISNQDDWAAMSFTRSDISDISSPLTSFPYGIVRWNREDLNGFGTAVYLQGGSDGIKLFNLPDGVSFNGNFMLRFDMAGNFGIGTNTPTEKLDVNGNANIVGTLTTDSILLTNSSSPGIESLTSIELQAPQAVRVINAPFKLANLTTTERNALTPENGFMIYNTTANKLQAYQNGSWINIDDGTAA